MIRLTKKQTATLDILENHSNGITEVIYGGSAGSAKSFIGCYWILKSALKYSGSRWLIGRSELKTLKQTTLVTLFEVAKMQGLQSDVHYRYKEQSGEIHLLNGSVIILKDLKWNPSDPDFDSLGSLEVSGVFADEIAQIRKKAWDVLKTRIRYRLDEFGIVGKIFGTLNPSKQWVYTYFYKPWKDGSLPSNKHFERALPTDNPYLPKSYLEVLKGLPRAERDRLYLGKWESDDDNQLISQDAINELLNNTWVKNDVNKHYYIIGDIARQGSDRAVIGLWRGLNLIDITILDKSKFDDLKGVIQGYKDKYKVANGNILLDEDGTGGFLVDAMRCKGFLNNSRPLNNENYQNLKTQCYYKLAQIINERSMLIDEEVFNSMDLEKLFEELEQVQSKESNDGKLKILSKDEVKSNIGRSPDISDMLAMRMFYEISKNNGIYNLL